MTQTTMREQWSSHTGFILAAIGGAVGLGNIWKFPYMAGSSGGGRFRHRLPVRSGVGCHSYPDGRVDAGSER